MYKALGQFGFVGGKTAPSLNPRSVRAIFSLFCPKPYKAQNSTALNSTA
jgi:hypothetical protein